jgi:hypothetical protein
MNKAKKLIIGGMLVAGAAAITGGGLTVAGSHDSHPAAVAQKPVNAQGAVKGRSVNVEDDFGPGANEDCNTVHDKISNGRPLNEVAVFGCDNSELQKVSRRGENSTQAESETCRLINEQVSEGHTPSISEQILGTCEGEEQAVKDRAANN